MSRTARLLAFGTLIEALSLAPLAWHLLTGADLPADLWRLGAAVGLAGILLQAGTLAGLALTLGARSCRRPYFRNP